MADPNHTTGATEIGDRLSADLVPTYCKSIWRGLAPEGELPGPSDLPVIVFASRAEYEYADTTDQAVLTVAVYVVRSTRALVEPSDTVVGRVSDLLHRWEPTVAGVRFGQLRRVSSNDGGYGPEHVADLMEFTTYASEG